MSPTVIVGLLLALPIVTFPSWEYKAIPVFSTVISPVVLSSNPYRPIPLSPTVIVPVLDSFGLTAAEAALVYIPTPPSPNVIVPEFNALYWIELVSFAAKIPVPFLAVLAIVFLFSTITAAVRLGA